MRRRIESTSAVSSTDVPRAAADQLFVERPACGPAHDPSDATERPVHDRPQAEDDRRDPRIAISRRSR